MACIISLRHLIYRNCRSQLINCSNKYFSSKNNIETDVTVSLSDDGQTIVCYHPEPMFPYEHTKPLPMIEGKYMEQDSVMKLKCREETDDILFNRDYTIEELMQITYTPKYGWYPDNAWKKQKKPLPKTRPGI